MTMLYKLPQAAAILGVTPQTIKLWHKAGKITLVQLPRGHWRVPESEVIRLTGWEKTDAMLSTSEE